MLVRFWGVRGSFPVPGPTTVKYGGNTPCISIELSSTETLVLDAGTGLHDLGKKKSQGAHTYYILLSHLHWDHIHGLTLFSPFLDAEARIEFLVDADLDWGRQAMRQFGGAFYPLCEDDLRATVIFREESPKTVLAPFFDAVKCIRANHHGLCYGYRFEKDGKSMVYLTDNEINGMADPPTSVENLISFCSGVDYLIHDAQFTKDDLPQKCGWGHSEVTDVCKLASDAHAGNLFLFHHDPGRTDDELDEIVLYASDCLSRFGSGASCHAAREGDSFFF